MTIPELLIDLGHPLGVKGRTTCPIHGGDNKTAFSFQDAWWHCHAGCGGGGIVDLRRELGLHRQWDGPPVRIRLNDLEGLCLPEDMLPTPPRVTRLLDQWVKESYWVRDDTASRWHREALRLEHQVEVALSIGVTRLGAWDELSDAIGGIVVEMRTLFDKAHRFWGAWPWPCGCNGGYRWVGA